MFFDSESGKGWFSGMRKLVLDLNKMKKRGREIDMMD
jgi:hypothetical protein